MSRATPSLLILIVLLLGAILVRPLFDSDDSEPAAAAPAATGVVDVLRAKSIEIVNDKGEWRAQLHLTEDGSGELRLREGGGTLRVKLGAGIEGGGLMMADRQVEPAIWMLIKDAGTTLTIAEQGKEARIITP